MDDLQERLSEAGRALDEEAPAFDASALRNRVPAASGAGADADAIVAAVADDLGAGPPRSRRLALLAAAAVVVAVVAGAAVLRVDHDTVSTGPATSVPDRPDREDGAAPSTSVATAEIPDVLEIDCTGRAPAVSSNTVRAQADGVHVQVHNPYAENAAVLFGGEGARGVAPGDTSLVVLLAPGTSPVRCLSESATRAPVADVMIEVVDQQGLWNDPTLDCELPSGPDGYGMPARGPDRATPAEAIRAWSGVLDDTVIRPVGYPDEAVRRYVAELPGGEILFALNPSGNGDWYAVAGQWCTQQQPSVRVAADPAQAWYDQLGVDEVREDLERIGTRGEDPATPPDDRLTEARLWCTDLKLQSRLLGDSAPPAPDPDLDAFLQEARGELIAAAAACPEDESTLFVDGAFTETDLHLVAAKAAIERLRLLVQQGG